MKRKSPSPSPSSKSPAAKTSAAKSPRSTAGARAKATPSVKAAAKKTKPAPEQISEGTSKQSQVIALLRGEAGASMADMMVLTGWQPHTVRGMLSGSLRKRLGLDVQCQRVDGAHVYRIVEAAAA